MARCWATTSGPMDCLASDDVVRDVNIQLLVRAEPIWEAVETVQGDSSVSRRLEEWAEASKQ
jgi:hypothetical protein